MSAYCGRVDSFSRNSAAALASKSSYWPLQRGVPPDPSCDPTETPLSCEIRLTRPAYAVILVGSNDLALAWALGTDPLPGFIANIRSMVHAAKARGAVPVLTTSPPQSGGRAEVALERLNSAIYRLAKRRGAPLQDLWRALMPLPNAGLATDGLHLSVYGGPVCMGPCDPSACAPRCEPANFTPAGLQAGSNVRNLATVAMLRRLWRLDRTRNRKNRRRG